MNYYNEIKENLIKCEIYDKSKDFSKNKNRAITYFKNGKLLNEAGKEYGKSIIKQYSEKLMIEVGKKYNVRTLYRMRKFYEVFSNEKLTPLVSKLSWSHYIQLLSCNSIEEIIYYINVTINNNLNKRQLRERINNHDYDKLSIEAKNKVIDFDELKVNDLVLNPIVIKTTNLLKEELTEYALKQSILENLDNFLIQLGFGFAYVGNEYKLKLDDRYNYVDLLLYNIRYRCYVVVELKVTELKKEHTGQIMAYMNYIDKNIKAIDENYTVGIIICKQDNRYVIKYCSDDRIIARKYELV